MTDQDALFDLHVHSVASDGIYSLLGLANLARRSGLAGLAVTDHDTLPNPQVLAAASNQSGVEMHAGVELSTHFHGRGFHVLSYGASLTASASLHDACKRLQSQRRERFRQRVEALRRLGVRFPADRLDRIVQSQTPGRLHLARELVRAGYCSSHRSAFQRYLVEKDRVETGLPLPEAVELIHQSGGVAVLAHPPARMVHETWKQLVACGLDGLETGFPSASAAHRRFLRERISEYGLIATAGSDFHGDDPRSYLGKETVPRDQAQAALGAASMVDAPHES